MLMDSMQPYAKELVALLPDRFIFQQNATWWFIRDGTWSVMDMRSDVQEWSVRPNIWQFLAPLLHEYRVKHISAGDRESLEEAAFKALIEAVKSSFDGRMNIPSPLNDRSRRNLLKQLAKLAPKHLKTRYDDTFGCVWFDCFEPNACDDGRKDVPRMYLTGNDFDSISGLLVLWDELEKNWQVSWKKATRSDSNKMEICDGYEVSLLQIVDANVVPLEYTVWARTKCEAIVRVAVAAWSN